MVRTETAIVCGLEQGDWNTAHQSSVCCGPRPSSPLSLMKRPLKPCTAFQPNKSDSQSSPPRCATNPTITNSLCHDFFGKKPQKKLPCRSTIISGAGFHQYCRRLSIVLPFSRMAKLPILSSPPSDGKKKTPPCCRAAFPSLFRVRQGQNTDFAPNASLCRHPHLGTIRPEKNNAGQAGLGP
ncbi:hypothetical protein L249_1475, partial [Ophiocordyceps polyrhachis-furcata BCC 54312]